MPSYNQGAFIAEAIESILSQNVGDIELIVMDGGSTDETLATLRHYEPSMRLTWRSEPDTGLYDALNKAIAEASGEWIGWLNTDDLYAPIALQRFAEFTEHDEIEVICGDAELFANGPEGQVTTIKHFPHYRGTRLQANKENLAVTHLNACIFRRNLLDRVGIFDTRYKIAADRDYLLRLMRLEPRSRHISAVACLYRTHPGSLTMGSMNAAGTASVLPADNCAWEELRNICSEHLAIAETSDSARRWCRHVWNTIVAKEAIEAIAVHDSKAAMRHFYTGLYFGRYRWALALARAGARRVWNRQP